MGVQTQINRISSTVSEQRDLIHQIKTELARKVSGGGAELPALMNPGAAVDLAVGKELIDENGNVVTGNVLTIDSSYDSDYGFAIAPTGSLNSIYAVVNLMIIKGIADYGESVLIRNGAPVAITAHKDDVSSVFGLAKIRTGTYTPSADISTTHTLSPGLGVCPNIFVFFIESEEVISGADYPSGLISCVFFGRPVTNGGTTTYYGNYHTCYASTSGGISYGAVNTYGSSNPGTSSIKIPVNSSRKLLAGVTYRWFALDINGMG